MTGHLRHKPQQHASWRRYQRHRGCTVEDLRNQHLYQQHPDRLIQSEVQKECLSWLQQFVKLRPKKKHKKITSKSPDVTIAVMQVWKIKEPFFWEIKGWADIPDVWLSRRLLSFVPHWSVLGLRCALSSKLTEHMASSDLRPISGKLSAFESTWNCGSSGATEGTTFETLSWAGLAASLLFLAWQTQKLPDKS